MSKNWEKFRILGHRICLSSAYKQLKTQPRIIIVDEIDYLAGIKKAIETIRDIHDKTDVPIILVGMNKADKKLMRYPHLFDRISRKLKFETFSYQDIKSHSFTTLRNRND